MFLNVLDIEDKHGFHGKPVGGKSDEVIAHIESQIVNKDSHSVSPPSPTKALPKVDLTTKLSEPPQYKKGDMVSMEGEFILYSPIL